MEDISKLNYQLDVTATLVDNPNDNYILWYDSNWRMIETWNHVNREIIGDERKKLAKIFGGF
jgi:hypothetical protein